MITLWNCVILATVCIIWLEKNARNFEDRSELVEVLWNHIFFLASLWASITKILREFHFLVFWENEVLFVIYRQPKLIAFSPFALCFFHFLLFVSLRLDLLFTHCALCNVFYVRINKNQKVITIGMTSIRILAVELDYYC